MWSTMSATNYDISSSINYQRCSFDKNFVQITLPTAQKIFEFKNRYYQYITIVQYAIVILLCVLLRFYCYLLLHLFLPFCLLIPHIPFYILLLVISTCRLRKKTCVSLAYSGTSSVKISGTFQTCVCSHFLL